MVRIVHNDYDRIADTVFWLNKEWVMKFIVHLNSYSEEYGKQNFHKEYGYSKKGNFAVSINRDFQYYLSIESVKRDSEGFKANVNITQNDIYFFQYKLNNAIKWFTDGNVFAKKGEEIIIPSKIYMERVDLVFGSYIEIEPSVLKLDNGTNIIGAMFYINGSATSFFMDVNRFLSFTYFISTFNMYLAAQGLLSYLGRPANGTNYNSFTQSIHSQQQDKIQPAGANTRSFFDKVKAEKI